MKRYADPALQTGHFTCYEHRTDHVLPNFHESPGQSQSKGIKDSVVTNRVEKQEQSAGQTFSMGSRPEYGPSVFHYSQLPSSDSCSSEPVRSERSNCRHVTVAGYRCG